MEELGCASLNELNDIDAEEVFGDDIISLFRFDSGGERWALRQTRCVPHPSISSICESESIRKVQQTFRMSQCVLLEEIKFLSNTDIFPASMTKVELAANAEEFYLENFPQLDEYMNKNNDVPQVKILKVTNDKSPLVPNQVVVSQKNLRKAHKKRGSRISPVSQEQPAQASERHINVNSR